MTVSLRLGGPEDVDAAVEVYVRSGTARRGLGPNEERVAQVRGTLLAPATWFFIARDDALAVGMAAAMPSRDNEGAGDLVPGLCYLDLIFVVPERWGDGIGTLLLDTVVADARGRGFGRIHLLTHDDNEPAHTLYASRGLTKTGWSRAASDPSAGTVSEWARDL